MLSTAMPDLSVERVSLSAKVGYDARFSLGQYRGMGRYLRRLLRPIAANAIGFCASGESDPDLPLVARGADFYPAWEQLSLPARVREAKIGIFVAPYNTAPLRLPEDVKLILVLHDFIYLRSTEELPLSSSLYQNLGRLYRRMVVPLAIQHAHRILCVSEHTREELVRRFRVAEKKISVIPNTIDAAWYSATKTEVLQDQDYVLCVSGEAPNKNLRIAIQGFAEYVRRAKDVQTSLKIAGVKPAYHADFGSLAGRYNIQGRVEFLPYLADSELYELYAGARAFLFPSRDEGFGIPLLEAMAVGLPVVASRASSIPEVVGSAALYFHPDSVTELADQLHSVLSNPACREDLSSRALGQAQKFHPRLIDGAIANFWKQVAADA